MGTIFPVDKAREMKKMIALDGFEGPELQAEARRKFPEEFDRIGREYGFVLYTFGDDGKTLVGLASPESLFEPADDGELDRPAGGGSGSRSKQRPLTSEAMCQIATGQLTRFMFEWMGMKRVPGYLHDLIIHRANPSSAQLRGNGSGPLTVETMLATPRDVARQVRYLSHYACLHIASWAVLLEYFLDIRTLDVKYGRYGRLKERASLMCQARALLDQMQQKLFRDLFRLVSLLPEWRPYVRIVKRHTDYTRSDVRMDFKNLPEFNFLVRDFGTLRGAFARMFAVARRDGMRLDERVLSDLAKMLPDILEDENEKHTFGPEFLKVWGDLAQISGTIKLLGAGGEDFNREPHDARYRSYIQNCKLSQDVINASLIEKSIKSISSLKSEATLKKIFAEMDRVSLREAKKPLEKVLAFAPVVPRWTHKPPDIVSPPPAPPGTEVPPPQPTDEPPLPTSERSKKQKKERAQPVPTREPCSVPVYVVPNIPEAPAEPVETKSPKIKTRGIPASKEVPSPDTITETPPTRTVYRLGKNVFETMDRLLVTGHAIDWVDFEKLMTTLEFSVHPSSGSARMFRPPEWATTTPFYVDRPHGSQVDPYLVRDLGKRLKVQYGWTIEWFSDERPKKAAAGSNSFD